MAGGCARRELERTLRNLAARASVQARYLEQLGTAPSAEELALEYDDVLRPLETARTDLWSEKVIQSLHAVDRALTEMSGERTSHLWTIDALEHRPEWARIRELASAALEDLRSQ